MTELSHDVQRQLDAALLRLSRGLGANAAQETIALMTMKFGQPPYDERFSAAPESEGLAMRNLLQARSQVDPQGTVELARNWRISLSSLPRIDRQGRRDGMLACGSALRQAGLFEEAIACHREAVNLSEDGGSLRAAKMELAVSLRLGGFLGEGRDLTDEVVAARREEYTDPTNAARLEAEEELACSRLELGGPSMPELIDLRERRVERSGMLTGTTANDFRLTALGWMRIGEVGTALCCAMTASVILKHAPSAGLALAAHIEFTLAEVHWAIGATKGSVARRHRDLAGESALGAVRMLTSAYGGQHVMVSAWNSHPSLQARSATG